MSELNEMALELDRVVRVQMQATQFVAGYDQADTARNGELKPRQSQLRTRLEHATTTVDRIAERLRVLARLAAENPPADGPSNNRDQGPI